MPVARVADFDWEHLQTEREIPTLRAIDGRQLERLSLRRGDLLLEKSGGGDKQQVGRAVRYVGPTPAICSNFVARVRPRNEVDERYLTYSLAASYWLGINQRSIKQTTGIQNLDSNAYLSEPWCIPATDEQASIANFLDRETGRIDALVEKKRRLIELLEEKRTALISHVVTGSPNYPKAKLGFYVDLLPGFAFPSAGFLPEAANGDVVPLLRGVNVSPGALRWEETVFWPANDAFNYRRYELREGDLVLGMDRPWIGAGMRVAKVTAEDVPSLLLQRVARLRSQPGLDQDYLFLLLASRQFLAYFEPILTGVSVPHISPEQIASFRFALPPEDRQREAVEMFNAQSSALTGLISRLKKQLDLLSEYRQALITAAVTGQIDVDVGAPDPEEAQT